MLLYSDPIHTERPRLRLDPQYFDISYLWSEFHHTTVCAIVIVIVDANAQCEQIFKARLHRTNAKTKSFLMGSFEFQNAIDTEQGKDLREFSFSLPLSVTWFLGPIHTT